MCRWELKRKCELWPKIEMRQNPWDKLKRKRKLTPWDGGSDSMLDILVDIFNVRNWVYVLETFAWNLEGAYTYSNLTSQHIWMILHSITTFYLCLNQFHMIHSLHPWITIGFQSSPTGIPSRFKLPWFTI